MVCFFTWAYQSVCMGYGQFLYTNIQFLQLMNIGMYMYMHIHMQLCVAVVRQSWLTIDLLVVILFI